MPARLHGAMFSTSGMLPFDEKGTLLTGVLQASDIDKAAIAAERAILTALAAIDAIVPATATTVRILHLTAYFAAAPTFVEGHIAMNKASSIVLDILSTLGQHTREVVHVSSLPLNAVVELRVQGDYQ